MSTDPWIHEYLKAQARQYEKQVGEEVTVHRYAQRPVTGVLMRVAAEGVIIAGFGVVSHYEIERVTT